MKQIINLGSGPGANNGDTARVGGQKINENFTELYNSIELLIGDSPVYNKIKVETGFSLVGQNITINSNWQWIIENAEYTNAANVVINIPFCATGKSRIDYIIPNSSNSFVRVSGVESLVVPVAPIIPNEELYATFFVVYDGAIGILSPTIIGGVTPYNVFKRIHKGYGNTNLVINEIGDIFCGWKNDGTVRYSEAKWLGGSLGDSNNFLPIVQTEI